MESAGPTQADAGAPTFYTALPPISDPAGIFDDSLYVPAPEDWWIAISDIRGSTAAVAGGRHVDVNFAAAAMIAALTNAFGQLPYQFGGDGAVALLPPQAGAPARRVLARVRSFARRDFQLDLRVGLTRIGALAVGGAAVRVARYEPSPGSAYAVFRGGGIERLELAVKGRGDHALADAATVAPDEDDGTPPDLSGLSCRWTPIKATRGRMVSLVLRCADHRSVHADIARIAGLPTLSALSPSSLEARWPPKGLVREAKARRGRIPLPLMVAVTAVITLVAWFFVRFRLNAGRFNAKRYIKEVTEGAVDFARADESLCVTFDCPADRIAAVRAYLDDASGRGALKYGMHVSDHAVMTCLVVSPTDGQHVHFVDGGDGGYTQAATQLKAQALAA
jgi:hypothetical protein